LGHPTNKWGQCQEVFCWGRDWSGKALSIAYLKASIATVKEHRKACDEILKNGNSLQKGRAKRVKTPLQNC
jgi:hypothetical protein